jgi:para-aminobenzoate synthetase component 1
MNLTTSAPALGRPVVHELDPAPAASDVFARLSALPHCIYFDSALRHASLGRYSFVAADPFAFWKAPADGGDALAKLARVLKAFRAETTPDLPPFQGGAAGVLSYDLGRSLESIPQPRKDEFHVPALAMGLFDLVVAFDHADDRAWIISQGFPAIEPAARRSRAEARLAECRTWLREPPRRSRISAAGVIPASNLAEQFAVAGRAKVTSNFAPAGYCEAVQRVIEYIHAGDVFQVNLSQRLLQPAEGDPVSLYLRLRERNAAPFAGYFDLGDFQICSASPERFLKVADRRVEARPIKGTRARTSRPEADLYSGDDLKQSEKDRAENVMIVDLMRNDMSRVCDADSIHVAQLCGLESYAYVQHLVSVVQGVLAEPSDRVDLLRAAFPGGSITGAPKVRAMEIIAELEPTARGAYCGSLGYFGFNGAMDTSILIRTITAGRGWRQTPVGGGIVAQSDPRAEYEETWHKAVGMLQALEQ